MDAATAQNHRFSVGQRVRILTAASKSAQTFTITGIAQFGTADNLAGQTLAAFTLPTAQRLLGETGLFDFIDVVAKPGADKAAVQRSIAHALPSDAEVVTGQTIIDEDANAVSRALSFLNTALLIFALIALFVGAFTIYNTFSIIVGQRTRNSPCCESSARAADRYCARFWPRPRSWGSPRLRSGSASASSPRSGSRRC